MLTLTGPLREELHQLRIKDNAVHAGLSLLPVLLNHGLNLKGKMPIFLNNNSLTVQHHMETTDAMEVGHQLLLTMLKTMVLQAKANTHTELLLDHARNKVEASESHQLPQPQDALDFKMLFKVDQSQSLLMLPTGAATEEES